MSSSSSVDLGLVCVCVCVYKLEIPRLTFRVLISANEDAYRLKERRFPDQSAWYGLHTVVIIKDAYVCFVVGIWLHLSYICA